MIWFRCQSGGKQQKVAEAVQSDFLPGLISGCPSGPGLLISEEQSVRSEFVNIADFVCVVS